MRYIYNFIHLSLYKSTLFIYLSISSWNLDKLTAFGFRKAFVKMKFDFVDEALDVAAVRAAYVEDPVVGEAFWRRSTAQHCPVTKLQAHLHRLSVTT